jgi:hypothetical protein
MKLLFIIYNLIDFYKILKKINFLINFLKDYFILLKKIKNAKKLNNYKYYYYNIKKVFKYVNIKTFFPIITALLLENSLIICEPNNIDNIHHYVLQENGELVAVTDEEEQARIEKEKIQEEIQKKKEEEEVEKLIILFWLSFFFTGFMLIGIFFGFFDDDDDDDDDDVKRGIWKDEEKMLRKKKEYFEKHPEELPEPYYTPYLKRWIGQEERLRDRTNPFFTGPPTGRRYNHFDAEYVDKYNTFIREWEDDHIYKSGRYWKKNKK